MNKNTNIYKEIEELETGKVAAARVSEIIKQADGSYKLVELNPEDERKKNARNFAIKTKIAEIRHQLNLTQKAFAELLGYSTPAIRKWESGAQTPPRHAMKLITIAQSHPELL